jgi:hypothetical protein
MKIGQDVIGEKREKKQFDIIEHERIPSGKWIHLTIKNPRVVYKIEHLDLTKQIYELPYGYNASIFTDGTNIFFERNLAANVRALTKAKRIDRLTAGTWTFKQFDSQKVLDFRHYGGVTSFGRCIFSRVYKSSPSLFVSREVYVPATWYRSFINIRGGNAGWVDKDTYELLFEISKLSKEEAEIFAKNVPPETKNHEMRIILKAVKKIL